MISGRSYRIILSIIGLIILFIIVLIWKYKAFIIGFIWNYKQFIIVFFWSLIIGGGFYVYFSMEFNEIKKFKIRLVFITVIVFVSLILGLVYTYFNFPVNMFDCSSRVYYGFIVLVYVVIFFILMCIFIEECIFREKK